MRILLTCLLIAAACSAPSAWSADKPNIVLVFLDNFG